MGTFNKSLLSSAGAGHVVNNSVYGDGSTGYFSRTPSGASDLLIWTYTCLVKLGGTGDNAGRMLSIFVDANNFEDFMLVDDGSGSASLSWRLQIGGVNKGRKLGTAYYRDFGAWYRFTISRNGSTVTMYCGQDAITALDTDTSPGASDNSFFGSANEHRILRYSTFYSGHYQADTVFVGGQALTPSSFGETDAATGSWKPKAYTGTYGTNGFHLKFENGASLGEDSSGNGNNFTKTGTVTQTTDSPTDDAANNIGNFCTLNPLDKDDGITSVTNGNRTVVTNGSNGSIKATVPFPSGKWYWEVVSDTINGAGTQCIGIMPQSRLPTNNMADVGQLGYAIDASFSDRKLENGTATAYGTYTQANGAVYMFAFDQDAGKLWYGVGGVWLASGDPAAGTNPSSSSIATATPYCAAVSDNTVSGTFTFNFGQTAFAYTPPTGFKRLCTANLPAPTIKKASSHFTAGTFTGTGATLNITGLGFQPDWVIIKRRNAVGSWAWFDAVRGATKYLSSDSTAAEVTDAASLTAFNADGFTLGTAAIVNTNTATYVYYAGKFNGAGSANTDGSISSTVSANATAGMSIVKWTGTAANATVGHGLGAVPKFIITKANTQVTEWPAYHADLANTEYMTLNTPAAKATGATYWNSTTPNSTVFSLGSSTNTNNTNGMIAHCFAEVPGFSKFGSYTGNGSADGPFVYCGFRPKFVLTKRIDVGAMAWFLNDGARATYNPTNAWLTPNDSAGEDAVGLKHDFVSNGFKVRHSDGYGNASGGTYIYAAFAEFPLGGIGTTQGKAR